MSDEKQPVIMLDENKCKKIDLNKLKDFFSATDLEWLPKNCKKSRTGEYQVLVIPYMNRGAVMNRLDAVCGPENWQDDYFPGPGGGVMCKLSIRINGEWITKSDGAENTNFESIKGGISDAFKRAATKWGIGRYLARLPRMFGIVHQGGAEYTKYKPKDGAPEWVNFDIPPIPAEWLPPGEIPATLQQEKPKYPPIQNGNFKKNASMPAPILTKCGEVYGAIMQLISSDKMNAKNRVEYKHMADDIKNDFEKLVELKEQIESEINGVSK